MASFSVRRFGWIVLGYLLACVAAGAVIGSASLLVLGPFALPIFLLAVPVTAAFALVPAGLVIAYAEARAVRSTEAYMLCGAAIGLVAGALVVMRQAGLATGIALVEVGGCACAGAIAGYVYHAVAGRTAGA